LTEHDPAPAVDAAVQRYYDRAPEEDRLRHGASQLEAARTRELIERHARRPPATAVDVGGAAGAYAMWLAEAGYEVHLIDASPRLVAAARRAASTSPAPLASCEVGDARALPFPAGFADIVLLLGPLYHLTTAQGRARALAEAKRVLKPEGVLFAAAISRWASSMDGLSRDLFVDPRFAAIVDRDLRDGQHRNTTEREDYFTTAYFHPPEELREEVAGAGFTVEGVYGLEGPGWILPDFDERWEDARRRSDLVRVARALEAEPSVLGLSAHLLAVGRR
jgi:SAM-dependent methyltransferase